MTTFAITTLGCKVNTYESQGYTQALQEAGYIEVPYKERADIYLINTCVVTNTAASKSRQKIHQAQALNPDALIVVVGCYVQTASEQLQKDLKIDLLVGSDQKRLLPQLIKECLQDHKQRIVLDDVRKVRAFEALPVVHFEHQTRAFLKIQDGCNQFCSYCIIPYARGAERSLHPDQVIQNAQELVNHGHLEIVLSGIHTGRYGKEHGLTLSQLLERMINEVQGLQRIRISSIEMNEVSDELITLMVKEEKIARHLHIPLQSANTDILKRMNRPYDVETYEKRIAWIRTQLPDISISSDVIVGFPSESEEQFQDTLDNIARMKLSFLHVFPFSKRDGTKAAAMSGQLDNKTKKERASRLMELSNALYNEYKRTFVGKEVDVLWEKSERGLMFGHTSEYLGVYAPLDTARLKTMQTVRIQSYEEDVLLCTSEEVTG